MRDALTNVLAQRSEDAGVDRILAQAFFRSDASSRAAGASARVFVLAERRCTTTATAGQMNDGFLVCGGRR